MSSIIKTVNLCKDYGGGRGVRGLTLEIPEKTVFGYIGPNGSGKTTTIRILCGLLRQDSGEAYINGVEVKPKNHVAIKRMVGYLPDEFGVYDQMSVWEYLDFFGAAFKIPSKDRRKRIEEVLDLTESRHMIDYQVNSLSRGMHQKIGIAKTLLHDPLVLILDEPANGLDPHARIEMRKTILRLKEIGKTIMLSSHILPELGSICDLVGIIEKGKLLTSGTVQEISQSLKETIHLEIMIDSDAEAAANACRDFQNINNVSHSGNELRAEFQGIRTKLADLNKHLIDAGVRVVSIKETEVDLENVFLAVTGRDKQKDEDFRNAAGKKVVVTGSAKPLVPHDEKQEEAKPDKPADDKKDAPADAKKEEPKADKPADDKKDEAKPDKPADEKKDDLPPGTKVEPK